MLLFRVDSLASQMNTGVAMAGCKRQASWEYSPTPLPKQLHAVLRRFDLAGSRLFTFLSQPCLRSSMKTQLLRERLGFSSDLIQEKFHRASGAEFASELFCTIGAGSL